MKPVHLLSLVTALACPLAAFAEDPCPMLLDSSWQLVGKACHPNNGGNRQDGAQELASGRQIILLGQILAAQQQLAGAVNNLVDATNRLANASDSLKVSNVAWRNDTLTTAIAEINKIPAAMAENQQLMNALAASLADRLAQDAAFRERLRQK